jgi:hypothetical protein
MALTQRGANIEVWVLDRRTNNIEDLTGLNAAEEAHDTNVAIDYYYKGAEINGRKFQGFLTDADVPYLSEFGLELAMKDVYTVITTNVPDPAVRRQKVFVGGHSLGGPFTANFAGWDFDGNPATTDDAGYMNCAGLIGLDTMLTPGMPNFESSLEEFLGEEPVSPTEEYYVEAVKDIRLGYLPRVIPPIIVSPEMFAMNELLAMEAAWNPDQESDLLRRTPYSEDAALSFQMIQSCSLDHFFYHVPSIREFRYTNEALFGIMVDDNYQPLNPLQASVGFLSGGAVIPKQFPLPQDWVQMPFLSFLKHYINLEDKYVANDAGPSLFQLGDGPLYTWANFDQIGDQSDPDFQSTDGTLTYTTATEEVSDIRDVARFMYYGPTNAVEWYFTIRIFLDLAMATEDFAPKYGLNFLHGDKIASMPQIDFVAEKGPMVGSTDNLPPEIKVIKGYNHLDVLAAAPDRPTRRPNELIDPILDFILAVER